MCIMYPGHKMGALKGNTQFSFLNWAGAGYGFLGWGWISNIYSSHHKDKSRNLPVSLWQEPLQSISSSLKASQHSGHSEAKQQHLGNPTPDGSMGTWTDQDTLATEFKEKFLKNYIYPIPLNSQFHYCLWRVMVSYVINITVLVLSS